jgi:hypothetical protein
MFRIGKAPDMEYTFRWPVMRLKDISNWAEAELRTISINSDNCPVPLDFQVLKFFSVPRDALHRAWDAWEGEKVERGDAICNRKDVYRSEGHVVLHQHIRFQMYGVLFNFFGK